MKFLTKKLNFRCCKQYKDLLSMALLVDNEFQCRFKTGKDSLPMRKGSPSMRKGSLTLVCCNLEFFQSQNLISEGFLQEFH